MTNSLQVILDEQDLAKENAKQLLDAFGAPFEEAGKILADYKRIVVTEETQTDLMAEAREKRLALKKTRVEVEHKRKELKEDALRTGKAIDGVAKYIKDSIQPAEEYLELQEKFAEVKAAERAAKLKAERTEKLLAYTDNLSIYNLDTMEEATFQTLLRELQEAQERKLAQEKAEREAAAKAEAERLAEEKRIREENEKLRAEALAKEKEREAEREAEAKKQAAIQAEKEKELAAERAKLEAERKKREAIEADNRKREQEAARLKAEQEETERTALLAPDKEKLLTFSAAMETIRLQKLPAVKTKQAQDVVNQIDEMLTKMQALIAKRAKEL